MLSPPFAIAPRGRAAVLVAFAAVTLQALALDAQPRPGANADASARIDYLTFAQGAVSVRIGGAGARLGATFEHAVRIVDGDATGFTFGSNAAADTETQFVYQLPAPTTFDRFAVPEVLETPSRPRRRSAAARSSTASPSISTRLRSGPSPSRCSGSCSGTSARIGARASPSKATPRARAATPATCGCPSDGRRRWSPISRAAGWPASVCARAAPANRGRSRAMPTRTADR
jgi:hypothetical protein